jgi:Flp pilus assembly protein TadG
MRGFKGERGASAVEFAIVLSLLFLVLFGIIQFGLAFNRFQGIQAAAREGARIGSIEQNSVTDIVNRVKTSVSAIDPSSLATTCSAGGSPSKQNQGCIWVYQVPKSYTAGSCNDSSNPCGAAANLTGSSTAQPCLNQQTTGARVEVDIAWKTRIQLVFFGWTVVMNTTSQFACE